MDDVHGKAVLKRGLPFLNRKKNKEDKNNNACDSQYAFDSKKRRGVFLESLRSFLGGKQHLQGEGGGPKDTFSTVQMRYNFHRSSFRQEIR